MDIQSFITNNLAPITGLLFLLIVLIKNETVDKEKKLLLLIWAMELLELVAYDMELITAAWDHPTKLRILLSAIGYSLRPAIVYVFIKLVRSRENRHWKEVLLLLPAFFAIIAAFSAFFTGIVYSYDSANQFHRGLLGYVPQILTILYLLYFIAVVMRQRILEHQIATKIMLLVVCYVSLAMALEAIFNIRSIGRTAIVFSTIFFLHALQTKKLKSMIHALMENENLKEALVTVEKNRNELEEIENIISTANIGIWRIELFDGEKPRMSADREMRRLLAIDDQNLTPEETYNAWYSRIKDTAIPSVTNSVNEMISGRKSETTYIWNHPILGEQYVRCSGTAYHVKGKGYILRGYHSNVTEEVQAEQKHKQELADALIAAQHANKAKTTFLNNMSHDIRTPMNAIIGFTSLAAAHLDHKEQVRDYLDKIMTSSNHLLSLINDVLDMSRIESGRVKMEEKEQRLSSILHDLRNILQSDIRAKRLKFFIDTVDIVDENIICDKLRLNQVLLNFMSNAIKFTKPGGTVGIRIVQKQGAQTGYASFDFIIRDTGIGMSPEFTEHIFEPFTREESSTVSGIPGTGLGMSITKNIVDMMGGTIAVWSEKNVGTEFTLSLCFRLGSNPVRIVPLKNLEGMRALVADNSMDTCTSVSKMLNTIGMKPDWTMSGMEAVYKAKFAYEIGNPYQVFIIDWLIPDLNGVEAVRRIRAAIGNATPIMILTAYDWSDMEDEAREVGVTAFCAKPLFFSELYEILCGNQPEEPKLLASEKMADFSGKRILIVEDNELNREIAMEFIGQTGAAIETAENGQIAVDMVSSSEEGYYSLIFMDIQMPVMDGLEATRTIRALNRGDAATLPIVAMSANAFMENVETSLAAGMNDHLAKPLDMAKVIETIKTYT